MIIRVKSKILFEYTKILNKNIFFFIQRRGKINGSTWDEIMNDNPYASLRQILFLCFEFKENDYWETIDLEVTDLVWDRYGIHGSP